MKTSKILSLVIVAAFAMISLSANAENVKKVSTQKVVYLNVMVAMQNPIIEAAMREQLNSGFLNNNQQVLTASVNVQNYVVRVYGSYDQWVWFFRPQGPNIDSYNDVRRSRDISAGQKTR